MYVRLTAKTLVIGVQHHILAQLLLALFDPTAPKVGHRRRNAQVDMKVCYSQAVPLFGPLVDANGRLYRNTSPRGCGISVASGYIIGGCRLGCLRRQWESRYVSQLCREASSSLIRTTLQAAIA